MKNLFAFGMPNVHHHRALFMSHNWVRVAQQETDLAITIGHIRCV